MIHFEFKYGKLVAINWTVEVNCASDFLKRKFFCISFICKSARPSINSSWRKLESPINSIVSAELISPALRLENAICERNDGESAGENSITVQPYWKEIDLSVKVGNKWRPSLSQTIKDIFAFFQMFVSEKRRYVLAVAEVTGRFKGSIIAILVLVSIIWCSSESLAARNISILFSNAREVNVVPIIPTSSMANPPSKIIQKRNLSFSCLLYGRTFRSKCSSPQTPIITAIAPTQPREIQSHDNRSIRLILLAVTLSLFFPHQKAKVKIVLR
jgi:hypothetical protein